MLSNPEEQGSNKNINVKRCCSICGSSATYIKPNGYEQWFKDENGFICRRCHDKKRKRIYIPKPKKPKIVREIPFKLCECGCGEKTKTKGARFLYNHHKRREITKDKDYEYVYAPDHPYRNHRNKVYRHRLVAEEYLSNLIGLKIYLGKSILIHHIDENPKNNHISNLMIVTRALHQTIHKTVDRSDYFCLMCHESVTYTHPIQGPKWFDYNSGHICHTCYKHLNYDYLERKNRFV